MASQGEEGWPLGLPPVTLRMRLVEAFAAAGAGDGGTSFVLNATPSFSSLSSSDLDTESTGSFFPEKTITLGSLIGLAGASYPSFRQTLSTMDENSSMAAGPRRLISRLAWRRSNNSGPNTNKLTSSWSNLIRCGSCRGSYDYPDDNSSIGAPPSLGHFLDEERELESISNNQAKVYINVMFEDVPGSKTTDAINPLFDSGRVNSPSLLNLLNNSLSNSVPVVNNIALPAHLVPEKANESQEHMSVKSYNHSKQNRLMDKSNELLGRMQAAAKSLPSLQKVGTSSKSKSRKHQRNQSNGGGVCVLSCVSHIWGFPKSSADAKTNQSENDEDEDSGCSSDETTCESRLESTPASHREISFYHKYSFDDSDCSIYFDDEEDPYMSDSKVQNANAIGDSEQF